MLLFIGMCIWYVNAFTALADPCWNPFGACQSASRLQNGHAELNSGLACLNHRGIAQFAWRVSEAIKGSYARTGPDS